VKVGLRRPVPPHQASNDDDDDDDDDSKVQNSYDEEKGESRTPTSCATTPG